MDMDKYIMAACGAALFMAEGCYHPIFWGIPYE